MKILLTNDDGINAAGIIALFDALSTLEEVEVYPIAPLTVQSATGHGVTFNEPLMIRDVEVTERMRGIAVDGRPADCVKLAITSLWPERMSTERPDLVVSGMNMGVNVGIHTIYSGTVAAAIEAAFLGVPSIAVSLYLRDWAKTRYDVAARHAVDVIRHVLADGLPDEHAVLNVNIPATEADGPRPPVHVVPTNLAPMNDRYDRRTSPAGATYFWAAGDGLKGMAAAEGSDLEAIFRDCITVTPLQYDLTAHDRLPIWRERLAALGD